MATEYHSYQPKPLEHYEYHSYQPKPLEHYGLPANVKILPSRRVLSRENIVEYIPPFPLSVLLTVGHLPGKATLLVWCCLWRESTCHKTSRVVVSSTFLRRYQLQRRTTHRSLQILEEAGLITINREGKHTLQVSVHRDPSTH